MEALLYNRAFISPQKYTLKDPAHSTVAQQPTSRGAPNAAKVISTKAREYAKTCNVRV
jgi:hypothetical protein